MFFVFIPLCRLRIYRNSVSEGATKADVLIKQFNQLLCSIRQSKGDIMN